MNPLMHALCCAFLFFMSESAAGTMTRQPKTNEAEGVAKFSMVDQKSSTYLMSISGEAAHELFDFMKYGTKEPVFVERKRPTDTQKKNGVRCSYSQEIKDYLCHFTIDSTGVKP